MVSVLIEAFVSNSTLHLSIIICWVIALNKSRSCMNHQVMCKTESHIVHRLSLSHSVLLLPKHHTARASFDFTAHYKISGTRDKKYLLILSIYGNPHVYKFPSTDQIATAWCAD
jgi:hypothetical protein